MVQGPSKELVKRTALWRKHLSLAASMTDHHGWEVAEVFTSTDEEAGRVRESVGLADLSWLGKFDLKGESENLKSQIQITKSVWWLAKGHWLVMCEPQSVDRTCEELEGLVADSDCLHLTDVTSVYTALLMAGPKSRDVLGKLTEIDVSAVAMPNSSCAQTGLAHVHAIILREDIGDVLAYRLLTTRDYGEYVWDAVMHAGKDVGIAPFGLGAEKLLR